ncbi:uncharacterized protein LACBIDRAFT_335668 [Laccaria bicolor S238N-H82]|uniref:Predicted protein n=1 Tax=Laccaria bicolor (strain S238N-H82 / ATCC MYA-4686) TaxID=486041 RepID=B0E307_LACBS|nr:uncharacterized protein LACBIDRAFT_335668 [Laccaria bicolor S238N-H82]EDQ98772.1 predicted protein [Laccaria bicolor S238N-H82]|eukprot:XP_001890578.1 predicted protein [Laccaria bicolor S238N-H82]
MVAQVSPSAPMAFQNLFYHAGRKCLVLDLDETLMHSSFKAIQQADYVVPIETEYQRLGYQTPRCSPSPAYPCLVVKVFHRNPPLPRADVSSSFTLKFIQFDHATASYFAALLMAACSYQVVAGQYYRLKCVIQNQPRQCSANTPNSMAGGANPTIMYNVARIQTATHLTTTAKAMEEITASARDLRRVLISDADISAAVSTAGDGLKTATEGLMLSVLAKQQMTLTNQPHKWVDDCKGGPCFDANAEPHHLALLHHVPTPTTGENLIKDEKGFAQSLNLDIHLILFGSRTKRGTSGAGRVAPL